MSREFSCIVLEPHQYSTSLQGRASNARARPKMRFFSFFFFIDEITHHLSHALRVTSLLCYVAIYDAPLSFHLCCQFHLPFFFHSQLQSLMPRSIVLPNICYRKVMKSGQHLTQSVLPRSILVARTSSSFIVHFPASASSVPSVTSERRGTVMWGVC